LVALALAAFFLGANQALDWDHRDHVRGGFVRCNSCDLEDDGE